MAWLDPQVGSQVITRAGQMVLTRLMGTQIWHPPAPERGKLSKGIMAFASTFAFIPKPDNSAPLFVSLVPFELLPQWWSSEWVQVSPYADPLREHLGLQQPFFSFSYNLHWFPQLRSYGNFSFWHWSPGLESPVWTSTAEISFSIFKYYMWVWDQHVPHLHPSSQSQCGFFYISLIIGLLFRYTSADSQLWLFCSLVVLLMWLWEGASNKITYSNILTGNQKLLMEPISSRSFIYTMCFWCTV